MKNRNPKISVVIPVYNGERFLEETILGVLNQTFEDFEFIIVDDKSTDNSLKMIKKYSKKDKRIIVITSSKNMGAVHARNKGLKVAKGKYVAALDADDVCLPKRFEIQFDYLEKNKDIYMVGGSAIVIDDQGKRLGVFLKYEKPEKLRRKLARVNCMIHPSIMHRNTQEFFYRDRFPISEDYDFILNVLSSGKKITNIPDFLIKYRINPSSNTFTKKDPDYFFKKAKEFYRQRMETGKEEYDQLKSPNTLISVNPNKSKLRAKIISGFQDNQKKKTRENLRRYFREYGFNLPFVGYYILSFLPLSIYQTIRKIT